MYINTIGYYIPENKIPNSHFSSINGLGSEWIKQRTGIESRARANEKETVEYMCIEAVEKAIINLPYNIKDVELIIFASYTPNDTIVSAGHIVQRRYGITDAKVFQISSACSSGVNGMEIIRAFFVSQLASKALLICCDRNSSYSNDSDPMSGHLWGDGAVAYFFSNDPTQGKEAKMLDVVTQGLGHIGLAPEAVYLSPRNGGLQMPHGKDVFMHACNYMAQNTKDIIELNGYKMTDLSYFIGHQANKRILNHVINQLNIPKEKSLSNIEELGNTGSASALLVFAQNYERFRSNDLICISVFGGGYSAGACLLRIA